MFLDPQEQLARIADGAEEVIPEAELLDKLERSRAGRKPLLIKQGFDPTRPDLHIGHAVSLFKLRTFQELGHQVVFVMGDFTARIGDPSGRDTTRPVLDEQEIEANGQTYAEQVFRVLDPERTTIRRNSEWLGALDLPDVLRLTGMYTVARMLERDDFRKRYADGRPIALSEFLYPMMQGYDSVELRADVELGGMDQKFNLLLARTLQERSGQEPQVCLLMPLLRGTDGERKMSKSYDNYVGLAMEPAEMFGRTMSIPDSSLDEWIRLASTASGDELADRLALSASDPLAAKRWLAADIVGRYQDAAAAAVAEAEFDRVHKAGKEPADVKTHNLEVGPESGGVWIGYALRDTGLVASTSEARRMIEQGAIRVDGETIHDVQLAVAPGEHLLQRGKRSFARIQVARSGE